MKIVYVALQGDPLKFEKSAPAIIQSRHVLCMRVVIYLHFMNHNSVEYCLIFTNVAKRMLVDAVKTGKVAKRNLSEEEIPYNRSMTITTSPSPVKTLSVSPNTK